MHVSHNPAPLVITIKNNLTYNYYFEFFEQLSQMGFITPIFRSGKGGPERWNNWTGGTELVSG